MSHPQLQINHVDKIYGSGAAAVHAVRQLDMQIGSGEIVALLGSSGCGKTSTLRMIAGFEAVSNGTIAINNRPIHELPPVKRNVAMAFEGYSLYPPLTVRENMAFALKASDFSKHDVNAKVSDIARLLEIEDILDRYPVSISGGQQQRASLGRALIRDADLHLLDEPMGQLEPQLRAVLRGRIKHLIKQRGLTAILVTHDQTEANALADRIAVMEDGQLLQFDTPQQIKQQPANLFSGTFIGEPPMNVLQASVEILPDTLRFKLTDGATLDYPHNHFSPALLERLQRTPALTLGVRPYAIKRSRNGPAASVVTNQWLGDQTHVSAAFAGTSLVLVEHDRTHLSQGDTFGISIAAQDLHMFDADSGAAIAHGGDLAR